MARAKKRSDKATKEYYHSGGFAGIPRVVLETDDFLGLSSSAKVVLLYIANCYRGNNNGDLSATHEQLKKWGIGSKSTLTNVLRELSQANLVIQSRSGRFLNPGGRCALYALTWMPIDECNGKHDLAPTITQPRRFRK
jgi:hypothetical protein